VPFDRSLLEVREACPLCGSPDSLPQLELDGFHIVNCRECSFKYVREVASEAANASYYEAGYSGERHRQGQEVNAGINIGMLSTLGSLAGKRLLDIGSGFGFFAARARDEAGMDAYGVELSAAERDWARSNLGVTSYASLDDIPDDQRFDVVTMLEVIEHIREPLSFIKAATARLKPDGYLLIGTDNFESYAVRGMGAGFPKWIPNQHISMFSPSSLRRAGGGESRFALRGTHSYTPWEYWARLAVIRLTGGRKGAKRFSLDDELASEDARPYRFFALRKWVNALYARLVRLNTLDGAMMYAVFQKV
jgi:2-polyprenyl-3-methyl-5-hydroxy-6-metoxy-1,4-benzoquinol methylase